MMADQSTIALNHCVANAVKSRWPVKRMRFVCDVNPSLNLSQPFPNDAEVTFLPMERVGERGDLDMSESRSFAALAGGTYTSFQDGDVIVAKITPCFENGKGAICAGLQNGVGFGTTELHVLRPGPGLGAKFLYYLTASSLFRSFGEGAMKGAAGQKRVPDDFLRDFPLPLPDLKEQERIIRFLDDRCGGIDEIISKKQRLIDLLAEQKSALITRAVTRGLNPSVPMKDSGIPWLGQVPTHWRFTKFGYLVRMVSGSTPDKGNANYWQGSVPWVSPKDMKTPVILDSEDHISEPAVRECGMHLLPVNSVLIVVRGMILAHSFPVAVTGVPVTINQDMKGLLPKPNCDAAFLAHYLRGTTDLMLSLIEDSAHGTKCLRTDRWKSVGLYLPDIPEQSAISRWIDEQNSRFVKVAGDLNAQIEKLLEYRSALITAAVTGQIDVNHRRLNSI